MFNASKEHKFYKFFYAYVSPIPPNEIDPKLNGILHRSSRLVHAKQESYLAVSVYFFPPMRLRNQARNEEGRIGDDTRW